MVTVTNQPAGFDEPKIAKLMFNDPRSAIFWLIVRLYVGWEWLNAGWEKLNNPAWTGSKAGSAMTGFVTAALKKASGDHADVAGWYAWVLRNIVMPYAVGWSWAITVGEILVGLGLIFGLFTGIAAFFGGLMNANYLLSGTVSSNPALFILGTWLVLAWRAAGLIGLDRWVLPLVGVPGEPGRLFGRAKPAAEQSTTSSV